MDSVNSAKNWFASVPNQVPEPEFYKFAEERSMEKFQIGQCWAIYIDEDALPRYYGQIKKIYLLPKFVLHVAWFYACPLPKSTIRWHDKTMPIGYRQFKFQNSKLNKYTVTNNFSYVVAVEPLKKDVYKIFPRIDVKFLALVKGFKSVYMARVEEEEADKVVKICVSEDMRFSHQIPSFRLTKERGGSLRGFWELDTVGMSLRTIAYFVISLFNSILINEVVCDSKVYEYGQIPILHSSFVQNSVYPHMVS
ncbi:uncharacterized protein [Solanum tuberosum]|uniref:uncharacterized protein n=1 Tax=Solanum tuberosum TaxID=4113 RepID=UPI00073A440C|nr:PREDICTED: uncharacterized protein LOC102599798 [Solanum tuberosum]